MSRDKLNTQLIYCIRSTSKERVYRSSRSPKLTIVVRTLAQY